MPTKSKSKKPKISTPALVTMQWLTYVFWALTSVSVAILVALIAQYSIGIDTDLQTEGVAYAIAAAFILLPIAFVLDIFFSRYEGLVKSNAFSSVKVVHSVLFAVISIVALVVSVFFFINMTLNSFFDKGLWIAVSGWLTAFVAFGLLFIRTVKFDLFVSLRVVYRFLMLSVVVVACAVALMLPFSHAMETRQSRAVMSALNFMTDAINNYTGSTSRLPASASDIVNSQYYYSGTDKSQVNDLLNKGLISYMPNIKPSTTSDSVTTYYYKLCGTFDKPVIGNPNLMVPMIYTEYPNYLNLVNVEAGTHCYNLSTTTNSKADMVY